MHQREHACKTCIACRRVALTHKTKRCYKVGQNHACKVCIRYFLAGNSLTKYTVVYGIWCIYAVLANPMLFTSCLNLPECVCVQYRWPNEGLLAIEAKERKVIYCTRDIYKAVLSRGNTHIYHICIHTWCTYA